MLINYQLNTVNVIQSANVRSKQVRTLSDERNAQNGVGFDTVVDHNQLWWYCWVRY